MFRLAMASSANFLDMRTGDGMAGAGGVCSSTGQVEGKVAPSTPSSFSITLLSPIHYTSNKFNGQTSSKGRRGLLNTDRSFLDVDRTTEKTKDARTPLFLLLVPESHIALARLAVDTKPTQRGTTQWGHVR